MGFLPGYKIYRRYKDNMDCGRDRDMKDRTGHE